MRWRSYARSSSSSRPTARRVAQACDGAARPLVLLLALPLASAASLEECTTNCQPTTDAIAQCNQRCFDQGYCCDGTTFASSHALLSCNHGCRIAWFAKDVAECKAHCTAGNAGGCSYDGSLETGTLHKCNTCQEGCAGSTSRDECAAGCDNAFAVNDLGLGPAMTFYNDLKYTSPPSPPPHQKNACTVATGMNFVENIEGTGYWSASAVFDDEQFAFVQAGDNWLWNDRGLLCVDGERRREIGSSSSTTASAATTSRATPGTRARASRSARACSRRTA